jgi:hypothetical protein
MKIYVNGQLAGTKAQTGAINTNTMPIYIGQNGNSDGYVNGKLDEVRIYNRALNASEIQDVMNYSQSVQIASGLLPGLISRFSVDPNPFRKQTTITFNLVDPALVHLRVFDTRGERVRELTLDRLKAGEHPVTLEAAGLEQGVYFYQVRVGNNVISGKIIKTR